MDVVLLLPVLVSGMTAVDDEIERLDNGRESAEDGCDGGGWG